MPAPWRATEADPQSAQAGGTGSRWPQWWQAISSAARWSTSVTSQSGHSQTRPQTRQERKFDQPRRFSSTIAFSPRRRTPSSAVRVRSCSAPGTPSIPTSSTGGSRRRSTLRAEPQAVVAHDALRARRGAAGEQHGALLARAPLGHHAGVVARVALLLVGGVVLLVDHDQAEVVERARRRPSAGPRTRAPRRCACAATRRSARARRGASAPPPRSPRSARRSGRRSGA